MSLSQFQLLQKIGEGAFSTVHKVKRIQDGKIYALKQVRINNLKEKQKENALNQVRLLASISCDYIIRYKESFFDQKSSALCIIIEYADNGDLQKLITKYKQQMKTIPETQIWKLAKHVLTALNVLHQKNIIHRDLKSANIFITKNQYKIADLNVSKLLKSSLAYTQTGTPYYASPEVWQDKPYELKSDIWSLGCILYETAALRPPFTATSMDGLYKKVLKGIYPRLPSPYSDNLQKFISKCLQISPFKRPSCRDLLSMLPENIESDYKFQQVSQVSEVNMLSTIKIPRNMHSWRNDLPKSNYDNQNFQTLSTPSQIHSNPNAQKGLKFGHLSQNKLRQIVKAKQIQRNVMQKKLSLKKINPESHQNYDSVRSKVYTEHHQPLNYNQSMVHQQKSLLPRVNKIYSDAVNEVEYSKKMNQNHNRVQQILNRMKQADRKKQAYNRPAWWG